jgi:hypothetical protein
VSDVLDGIGEDADGEGISRRRSLWLLLGLFITAGLVAVLMIVLSGGGSKPNSAPPASPNLQQPVVTSHSPTIGNDLTAPDSPSSTTETSTDTPTQPSFTPVGTGDVVAAVNQLRAEHHLGPVTGTQSAAAQQCAVSKGSGATCVPHYVFAAATSADATVGVEKIQAFNATWLLDPTTTRIEYGWSHAGSQYYLAVLKWP